VGAGTVVLGVVLTSIFTPLQESAVQRVSLLFDQTRGARERTSGRSDLLLGAWDIFKRHPFGVGTGGFETTGATLGSVGGQRQFMRAGQKFAAHSGWTRVLAENGFLGFGVLAAFVLSFAAAGIRRRHRTDRNLGLLAACGLGLSLVSGEFHLKGLLFLAAGAAALLSPAPGSAPRTPLAGTPHAIPLAPHRHPTGSR
jgi:O-antigen ligase